MVSTFTNQTFIMPEYASRCFQLLNRLQHLLGGIPDTGSIGI